MSLEEKKDIISSLMQELRRGTIVLSVLSQLDTAKYGYSLVQRLEELGMSVDASTLYPLLRRLEKQELLRSEWEVGSGKPRKYYSITPLGQEIFVGLKRQWRKLAQSMEKLLENAGGDE